MSKTIGVREFRESLESVFDEVETRQMPYIVTRDSRPGAVLVPYEEFLRFQEFQESKILARFDQVWERLAKHNAGYSEEEVAEDVAAARSECKG